MIAAGSIDNAAIKLFTNTHVEARTAFHRWVARIHRTGINVSERGILAPNGIDALGPNIVSARGYYEK